MKRPVLAFVGVFVLLVLLVGAVRWSSASSSSNDNTDNRAIVFAHLINPVADCRSMGIGGWFAPDAAVCRESDTQGHFGLSWCVGGGATRPSCSPYKSGDAPAAQQTKPAPQAPPPAPAPLLAVPK